jgi:hypothetical protein
MMTTTAAFLCAIPLVVSFGARIRDHVAIVAGCPASTQLLRRLATYRRHTGAEAEAMDRKKCV